MYEQENVKNENRRQNMFRSKNNPVKFIYPQNEQPFYINDKNRKFKHES